MIKTRLEFADEYMQDAKLLYEQGRFNSAISRLYYASYHAMWASLGNPDEGRVWKHLAIIKPFVHGYWFNPSHPLASAGLFESFRLPLRQLYTYRIKADYELDMIRADRVKVMLEMVAQVIATVSSKGGA